MSGADAQVVPGEQNVATAEQNILAEEQRGDAFSKKRTERYWEAPISHYMLLASSEELIGTQKNLAAAPTAAGFILVERH